jgi:hypothetical protein
LPNSSRKVKTPQPVKLIVGFIAREENQIQQASIILQRHFKKIDFESALIPFTHTDYYREEFGTGLKRKFISFVRLIRAQDLPKIKLLTNQIETKLSRQGKRGVNIDPGYLDMCKLVLATTKDYKHRLYLGRGIYGEVTLFYQDKTFQAWEWTYPDYRTPAYLEIFSQIRKIYASQIQA